MLRRGQVRMARRDLIWGLLAFVLLQLGLAGAIEGWLPQFRDPYYGYRAARLLRRYRAEPRPLSVLVLGSSQVQDGLMPALLERPASQQFGCPVMVFNFGVPAAGPVMNLLNYRRLRAAGFRPDLLLLEVAPICLSEEGSTPAASGLVADRLAAGRSWLCWAAMVCRSPNWPATGGNARSCRRMAIASFCWGDWFRSWCRRRCGKTGHGTWTIPAGRSRWCARFRRNVAAATSKWIAPTSAPSWHASASVHRLAKPWRICWKSAGMTRLPSP